MNISLENINVASPRLRAFDPTKPVQTRGGLPARIIAADRKNDSDLPITALVLRHGTEYVEHFTSEGRHYHHVDSDRDLINIPVKRRVEVWVNLYPVSEPCPYMTRADADFMARAGRVACKKVVLEYTEGEGL